MCGMCGAGAADPLGALVAGPTRRALVADRLNALLGRDAVKAFVSGWTVSAQTGSTSVYQALGPLLAHVAPTVGCDPERLREVLLEELAGVSNRS
jgi:hypothetical protein